MGNYLTYDETTNDLKPFISEQTLETAMADV